MKLEVGKRYVLRNGEVTGYLHECRDTLQWMTDQYKSWLTNGGHYNLGKEVSGYDIVAEYSEPDPSHDVQQPLRWVENCKPDKPGIWALLFKGEISVHDVNESEVKSGYLAHETRCYLGPIPEILPPLKKVVQRLWLLKVRDITSSNCAEYSEHWLGCDEQPTESGEWIRTNRTREVEQ